MKKCCSFSLHMQTSEGKCLILQMAEEEYSLFVLCISKRLASPLMVDHSFLIRSRFISLHLITYKRFLLLPIPKVFTLLNKMSSLTTHTLIRTVIFQLPIISGAPSKCSFGKCHVCRLLHSLLHTGYHLL